ncbi:TraM recognition domain-containing protein, partial [Patescibacteria group bacterium]|nr:TraM recognition domain-containing protein [Patescibacteria group bacterium]
LGVFKKLWADSWGPRLEYTLRNAILAILDYDEPTLLGVVRMLSDKVFRKKVVESIQDPVVKLFWTKEFAGYTDKFASEAVAPIQNKVGQFLSSSIIRNIVGQAKSSINIREIMDQKKILIMNLSKGLVGEDNMQLLGAMMITKIQLAAMSRVDTPEEDRKDFYLYVDEFQNFATESFANILSEARKYRLNLIMAHQYIEQLDEKVRDAVFGNVGSFIVCRVGAADAESLAPEFIPTFTEEDIVNIPKYEFYCKLMIDGIASEPFSARGLPPKSKSEETGNVQKIITASREKYTQSKYIVEERIAEWHNEEGGASGDTNNNSKQPNQNYNKANNLNNKQSSPINFNTQNSQNNTQNYSQNNSNGSESSTHSCAECAKPTRISFTPDGIRPIYCRECLEKIKENKKNKEDFRFQQKQNELNRINEKQAQEKKQAPQPFKLNLKRNEEKKAINLPLNEAPRKNYSPTAEANDKHSGIELEGELIEDKEVQINEKR